MDTAPTRPAAPAFGLGFRTAERESPPVGLPVTGTLPDWLAGSLLRNGPALYESGGSAVRHWFDGQAMLHRFTLEDGRVGYTSRYLDTPSRRALGEGRIGYPEFATDPCRSLFARFFTRFTRRPTLNAAVHITRFGGHTVALTETPMPVAFDPETLETAGVVGYTDHLRGQTTTAHPHQDPETGDLVNFLTHFGRTSEYRLYRQPPSGTTRELISRHKAARPAYMHSFAITRRYAVLTEFPLVVFPPRILLSGRPFIENYRWDPARGTRFTVVDLRTGEVRGVYTGPAMFAFHHINAYEEDGDLVVDLCAFEDAAIIDSFYLATLRAVPPPELPPSYATRCRLGAASDRAEVTRLSAEPLELPRIAYERCNGAPYRYVYGTGAHGGRGDDFLNQLVKLDVKTGATRRWHEPGRYPGEPVFVPAPHGRAEDDGVLLSVVLDPQAGTSFLLVLDAGTLAERARAHTPHPVPFGFHGVFTGTPGGEHDA